MALWETRKQQHAEDLILSDTCTVSKDLVEYLANFQLHAIRFLWKHYREGQGCILSGESGLGKISAVLAFLSAIRSDREKILVVCKNPLGVHHWMYQLRAFFPITSSFLPDDLCIVTLDVLDTEWLSGRVFQYIAIDARHAGDLTAEEIKKIKAVACKRRLFVTSDSLVGANSDDLRKILQCVDTKWLEMLRESDDIQLTLAKMNKFLLRQQKNHYEKELPLRNEEVYQEKFAEWRKCTGLPERRSPDILSQESDGFPLGGPFLDSGTPDLIFSEEEIVKTSSRLLRGSSQNTEEVIPASPDSQPLFRRRFTRRRILSTQTSRTSGDTEKTPAERVTPNLFESSEESEIEQDANPVLNTSTPLSIDSPEGFLLSQSPIQSAGRFPPPKIVDLTHDATEVFEITTNPTFSHQIRVTSKREVSPVAPVASPKTPKTPESSTSSTINTKWPKSLVKAGQDGCETPRSSTKSSGWLSKVSPKRSQHQRLTPKKLSITFEVQRKEEEALRKAFSHPIPTQEPEVGFPRKRRRLKDFLKVSSDDEDF